MAATNGKPAYRKTVFSTVGAKDQQFLKTGLGNIKKLKMVDGNIEHNPAPH